MKFCQKLREQREVLDGDAVPEVLDYKRLKKMISFLREQHAADPTLTDDSVEQWMKHFRAEVKKFDEHVIKEVEDLQAETCAHESCLGTSKTVDKNVLKDCYLRVKELEFFVELNKTAVRKILKKFDKNVPGYDLSEWRDGDECKSLKCYDNDAEQLRHRVTSVYAAMYKGNRAKQAEMELDCHVSCVSDVLAYMMGTDGCGGQQATQK
eukprot:TRINITY_DN12835_c0_g1_i1.p1 TRINITY_DN12835_c0_g1~~TRINITY_DN12835_c0_g1_i1.p1  ORF type:complete len:209 (+),score=52.91 TRINITY_DN12835_c0_g1_i1:292-918(+)